jgi:hypothetical protein
MAGASGGEQPGQQSTSSLNSPSWLAGMLEPSLLRPVTTTVLFGWLP